VKRLSAARSRGIARLLGVTLLSGAVLLVALVVAGCGSTGGSGGSAPDFQVTTFAGDQVSLSLYRGKPLVLAFMASW
jgi:hypothetical protein